jgi:hypothetical protein
MNLLALRIVKLARNAVYFGASILFSALAIGLVDELSVLLGGDDAAGVADFHSTGLFAAWVLQVGLVFVAAVFMISEVVAIAWEESTGLRRVLRRRWTK